VPNPYPNPIINIGGPSSNCQSGAQLSADQPLDPTTSFYTNLPAPLVGEAKANANIFYVSATASITSIGLFGTPNNDVFGSDNSSATFYQEGLQAPVPTGQSFSLQLTATLQGNSGASSGSISIVVVSDTFSQSVNYNFNSQVNPLTPGTMTIDVPPLEVGPSGQYAIQIVVSSGMFGSWEGIGSDTTIGSGSGTTTITVQGCGAPALPAPASSNFSLQGWTGSYQISPSAGLELNNVAFGPWSLATEMSLPYFNLTTSESGPLAQCDLSPDNSSGSCASHLISFDPGSDGQTLTAAYEVDNIPSGRNSCMFVTQSYEFDPENSGYPTFHPGVSYNYQPDDPTQTVTSIELAQYFNFNSSPNNPPGKPAQEATLGLSSFPFGNPISNELFVPNAAQSGSQSPLATNYIQTYSPGGTPQPIALNDLLECSNCVFLSWGHVPTAPSGAQSVDIAVMNFRPGEDNPQNDFSTLVRPQDTLGSSPIVLYVGDKSTANADTFSLNGDFFLPNTQTAQNNVSSDVKVTETGFVVNRVTRNWYSTLTVTNTTNAPIDGPIEVVLTNLSSNATLLNESGTYDGSPYIAVTNGNLAPGASIEAAIQFTNSTNGLIVFTPVTYSGSL
jgi:hypothetical protein